MTLKDESHLLFGTKIYNQKTKQLGLVIYTWTNSYADGDVPFATCVDTKGKKYNIELDYITPEEDLED